MAKIINIHTGEMREELRVPDMECTICMSDFSLEDDGGTAGFFGLQTVYFCQFCMSSMVDMIDQLTKQLKEEKE